MAPKPAAPHSEPQDVVLRGPITYRGSDADAHEFLDAVQRRVASVAVRVRWLGGSAVWFDDAGAEVARVTADRPMLLELIASWARTASKKGEIEMDIADRD